MKNTIIGIVIVVILGFGIYYFINSSNNVAVVNEPVVSTSTLPVATTTPVNKTETVIGKSVQGRDIVAYHFGTGETELLFVGGIHGSYAWNTGAVASDLADYLKANPTIIPENLKVTIIPVLNPDGMVIGNGTTLIRTIYEVNDVPSAVFVRGRFNANTVDLNRNFDCDWQAKAT
jgi:murein tripeptide amidase MpaA